MIVALTASFAVAADPVDYDYKPLVKPKPALKVGMSQQEFDSVVAGLKENAAGLLDGQIPNRECLNTLDAVQYDAATWKMAEEYLKKLPGLTLKAQKNGKTVNVRVEDCHKLYIICKLTAPLLASKPDVILEAIKTVEPLENKYHGHYLPIPVPKPEKLAACRIPAKIPKGAEATDFMAKVDQARQVKLAQEFPAICTNLSLGELDRIYVNMLAFAEDKAQDAKLVDWILTNEAGKNEAWMLGVEALICEAASGDMSKERAEALEPETIKDGFIDPKSEKIGKLIMVGKSTFKDPKDTKSKADKQVEWSRRYYYLKYTPDFNPEGITPDYLPSWDNTGFMLLTAAKRVEMVAKGIKDLRDRKTLLVHNPRKGDNPAWKAPDHPTRPFASDPERWWIMDPNNKTRGNAGEDPAKNTEKAPNKEFKEAP
jgi:hypothetical protein